MKANIRMAKALLCYTLALILIWMVIPVSADAAIYSQVLRLHVLADDDSEQAQQIKLEVRDEMLKLCRELFADCSTREEAVARLQEQRKPLEEGINSFLKQRGAAYTASVRLSEEQYETREYEGFRLPAGKYLSVRVILGQGEGKNWWCVLFPPLCLSCAQPEDELLAGGVGEESVKVFTVDSGPYRFRFRLLELLGQWFG